MSKWPAVDVTSVGDTDLVLAIADDFSPTAVEPRDSILRLFFSTATTRDAAHAAVNAAGYRSERVDVDDEDWARRSQENLKAVTVGRVTVTPPWTPAASPQTLAVVIQPSTGFGTGHHATTRLCLHALQTLDLSGLSMLDVGTGSGVLAIAARMLGAARALGVDYDADAIRAANENLELNAGITDVEFRVADLSADRFPAADIVTANLTGALLARSARLLWDLVRPGGTLVVSGLLEPERDEVFRALLSANLGSTLVWEQREDGWAALGMCCN